MEVIKMKLVHCNPNRTVRNMNRDIDSLFGSFFNGPFFRVSSDSGFMPRVDIAENKDNVFMHVELPGMDKDQIKIQVEDGILTVSGERKLESEKKDKDFIRTERSYGSFSRSFTLPDYVDPDRISADYKDGLLNVVLPRSEKAKPKEIAVKVK
jgi:HSP20 family protein